MNVMTISPVHTTSLMDEFKFHKTGELYSTSLTVSFMLLVYLEASR